METSPEIGFSASVIESNHTGLGNYAHSLLVTFVQLGHRDNVTPIHYKDERDGMVPINEKHTRIKRLPLRFEKVIGSYIAFNQSEFDLIHFPVHRVDDYVAMRYAKPKKVLTIHDITPCLHQFKDNQNLWRLTIKKAANSMDKIIVDSQNTLADCHKHMGIPEEKMVRIPLAADTFRLGQNREGICNAVKAVFKIDNSPILMTAGLNTERKNLIPLLNTFATMKTLYKIPHKLVVVGDVNDYVKKAKEFPGTSKDVIYIGWVNPFHLNILYNAADIFLYPSSYEGFGLPPLEAMMAGTPTICSNASSLPEVVGDGGILLPPLNGDVNVAAKWVETIRELLTDENLRKDWSRKGMAQSENFSWNRTAESTWNTYQEVIG